MPEETQTPVEELDVGASIGSLGALQAVSTQRPRLGIRQFGARFAMLLVLAGFFGLFSALEPDLFPTWGNVRTIISAQAVLLILALSLLFPMRAGDFDLSMAANMSFGAAIAGAAVTYWNTSAWQAVVIALACGLGFGIFHAVMIVGFKLDAFIVTLGSLFLLTGLTFWVSGGRVFLMKNGETLVALSRHRILGLQAGIFFAFALALVIWYIFEFTAYGRYLLVVGDSREAARLMGLSVKGIRASAFIITGILASFSGVLLVGKLGAVDPSIGLNLLLPPYASVFIGATVIQLGRFNVLGTVIGLYMLAVGITGLQFLGAEPWVSNVFYGGGLILAILFARIIKEGGGVSGARPPQRHVEQ